VGDHSRAYRLEHIRRRNDLSPRSRHLRTMAEAGNRFGRRALPAAGRSAHRRAVAGVGRGRAGSLALSNDGAGPHLPPAAQAHQPDRHRFVDLWRHRDHGRAGRH